MARARSTVFLAALAIKASVLWVLHAHPLLQPAGDMDGAVYLAMAHGSAPPVAYFVSPLYLYFLTLAGASIAVAQIVQIVLGSIGVVLLFDTARRWFGPRGAIVTATLAILTGVITFNEVTILQSALDPFLTALVLWLVTIALQDERPRMFAAAGAAAALFALNRPNALLWIVVFGGLVLVQRRVRAAAAFALGCALILAPVAARNYIVARELVLVSSHGGLNFYIGNNPEADGTYHAVPGIRPTIAGQVEDTKRVAEAATGRVMSSREVSRWFYGRAFDWTRARPADAARLFARKLAYTIHQTDLALNFSYDYFRRDVASPLRFLIVGPWLLVPLGFAGAATRCRERAFLTWFAFVPIYALSVALFFVASRYRLPLLVALAVAAGGVVHVKRAWQVIFGLLFAVVALWPFALDSGRSQEQVSMVVWLIEHRQFDDAERMMAQVEPEHTDPARLHHRAALAYVAAGDRVRANALFERVLRDPQAQPVLRQSAVDELARGYVDSGRIDDARRLFASIDPKSLNPTRATELGRLALEIRDSEHAVSFLTAAVSRDPRYGPAWHHLGVAYLARGDVSHAIAALTTARSLMPNDAPTYLFLGICRAQSGDVAGARRDAAEALRLRPGFPEAERLLRELPR